METINVLTRSDDGLCHLATGEDLGRRVIVAVGPYQYVLEDTGETVEVMGWGELDGTAKVYASEETAWAAWDVLVSTYGEVACAHDGCDRSTYQPMADEWVPDADRWYCPGCWARVEYEEEVAG